MRARLGFMQGRLVDQVDGRIQAFPARDWRDEFPISQRLGIHNIEWTLDDEGLESNPLCTREGRDEIGVLSRQYGLRVHSITGDCFMQAPFWKQAGEAQARMVRKLDLVIEAAAALEIGFIVVPLVDQGSIETPRQAEELKRVIAERHAALAHAGVQIVFESDYAPAALRVFIAEFPSDTVNINYDIGNSASLGHDPVEEIAAYGERIRNVHVKDRLLGGTTVPLGTGAAQFDAVFASLAARHYRGHFIFQTARAPDGKHAETLAGYMRWTEARLERHFES